MFLYKLMVTAASFDARSAYKRLLWTTVLSESGRNLYLGSFQFLHVISNGAMSIVVDIMLIYENYGVYICIHFYLLIGDKLLAYRL